VKCPRCDRQGMNVTTERGSFSTLVRSWRCGKGHRFSSIETYMPTQPVEKHMLLSALRAIATAFGMRAKDSATHRNRGFASMDPQRQREIAQESRRA
jgi:hypothetical protein